MTEGTIVGWLKNEGDPVEKGEALLEIETDKANLEVEALEEGVLRKIFHAAGETCEVLSVLGVIGAADEDIDFEALRTASATTDGDGAEESRTESEAPTAAATAAQPGSSPVATGSGNAAANGDGPSGSTRTTIAASPAARRAAAGLGVALTGVQGSGPRGRILRQDVERLGAAGGAAPAPAPISQAPQAEYPPPSPRPPAQVKFEGMRRAIATALQASKQTIPHFYETIPIDLTAALEIKRARDAAGTKVSVNDLFVRAVVLALADEPKVNCRVHADHIDYLEDVNVGIAVGSEEGLVVPVIVKAQKRNLTELAAEVRRVASAAREGKLIGMGQGTFTISNLGMYGIESFSAIVNPPEGAILAVGAARAEIVPFGGGFVPRSVARVTLSCDHRAIDGVIAARFLSRLRHLLENPARL